jgi:DNA-directed RNA polymerase subunit N (RpoN/RPB10)
MSKAKIKADETITKQVATIKNRKVVSELWDDYGKDPSSNSRDRLILALLTTRKVRCFSCGFWFATKY